jgi:hypothetical protein
MSDKLKSGVSVVPDFNDGEQPSAIKFAAIGAQVKLGFSLLEDAIGDVWGESYPYSPVTNSFLNIPWGRQRGSNTAVANLPNALGRPAVAVNLARLVGSAANLNPQWLEGSGPITGEEIEADLHQFTLLYLPTGTVTFGSHGGALTTLRASIADLDTAGDYYIDGKTVWCVSPTIGGTTADYTTDPSTWGSGGNYQGARFNVIPDPNQITALSSEQISIAGPAGDGSYTVQLPKITHQQSNDEGSSSALAASSDPNFDRQLELPTVLTDSLVAGDVIPDGFMLLRNNTTREVYREAVYEYSDADTFIVRSIDLGVAATYNAQEFSVITVGTDITTSIDDLRRKAMKHDHSGSFGEHPVSFEHLVDGQKFAGASGVFTKSENASNFLPQYLHRDGYRPTVDGNVNDENIMRGNLVLGKFTGTPGDYLDAGVTTFGVYFGAVGFASHIKSMATSLRISGMPGLGGGVDIRGEAFLAADGQYITMDALAGALTGTATTDVDFTATTGDVNLTAGTDVSLTASTDIGLLSGADIYQSVPTGGIIKMFGNTTENLVTGGAGVIMDFGSTVALLVRQRAIGTESCLKLEFSNLATPTTSNNWIEMHSSSGRRGRICAGPLTGPLVHCYHGSLLGVAAPMGTPGPGLPLLHLPLLDAQGDAQFISGNADYGEWLPIGDKDEWPADEGVDTDAFFEEHKRFGLPEGMVVWIREGQIWKSEGGTPMVVTCRAIMVGNDRDSELPGEVVSFVGQVPVVTFGPVSNGDYLVPLGNHCVAVSPDSVSFSEYRSAIGTAWASSSEEEYHRVLCAIGKK